MSFRDLDEIAEETYRRCRSRLEVLRAETQRAAAENQVLLEESVQRIRRKLRQAEAEAGGRVDAQDAAVEHRPDPWPGDPGVQRDEPSLRREAIARSAAARRSGTVVTPTDDDGDYEAEYYRRNSWLV